LSVNIEINLLSLVSSWLDKFCQITTKNATVTFHQLFTNRTHPGLHVFNIFVVKTQQGFAAAGMALDVGTLELEATGTGKRSLGSRQ
jgi:hypothetical protein